MTFFRISELILSQPLVGTTVKTDGEESDPCAFLTVLNMHFHKVFHLYFFYLSSISVLKGYIPGQFVDKSYYRIEVCMRVILAQYTPDYFLTILAHDAPSHFGSIFSERLVNMQVNFVPHMYRMSANEIQWACDDGEPYHVGHLLVLSRTYTLSDEEAGATSTTSQQQKRRNEAVGRGSRFTMKSS